MATTLPELIRERLGLRTRPVVNPQVSTLGVSSVRVFGNNPNRVAFLFVNLSTVDMFIRPLAAASSTSGIRAGPGGGSVSVVWDEDFDVVGYEWFGIADAAASALFSLEIITY